MHKMRDWQKNLSKRRETCRLAKKIREDKKAEGTCGLLLQILEDDKCPTGKELYHVGICSVAKQMQWLIDKSRTGVELGNCLPRFTAWQCVQTLVQWYYDCFGEDIAAVVVATCVLRGANWLTADAALGVAEYIGRWWQCAFCVCPCVCVACVMCADRHWASAVRNMELVPRSPP